MKIVRNYDVVLTAMR